MSKQGKIRLYQWILDMEPAQQILFFSFLSRELTTAFRGVRAEKSLGESQILNACSVLNDVQHRLLQRLLPTPKLDREQAEFIISEITRYTESDKVLMTHLGAALNAARRRTRDEGK